eukprot:988083-Rhodomonas_salina.3
MIDSAMRSGMINCDTPTLSSAVARRWERRAPPRTRYGLGLTCCHACRHRFCRPRLPSMLACVSFVDTHVLLWNHHCPLWSQRCHVQRGSVWQLVGRKADIW